jgi:hypothetical protein
MEIEPPQRVGQHVGRQDADRDAMLGAETLGDRPVKVAGTQPQLVRQRFGGGVEIGKVIPPPLDLAAHQCDRVVGWRNRTIPLSHPVEHARKGLGTTGRAGQPFLDLVAVDRQVGEHGVRQTTADRLRTAARFGRRQGPRIEVEAFRQFDQ